MASRCRTPGGGVQAPAPAARQHLPNRIPRSRKAARSAGLLATGLGKVPLGGTVLHRNPGDPPPRYGRGVADQHDLAAPLSRAHRRSPFAASAADGRRAERGRSEPPRPTRGCGPRPTLAAHATAFHAIARSLGVSAGRAAASSANWCSTLSSQAETHNSQGLLIIPSPGRPGTQGRIHAVLPSVLAGSAGRVCRKQILAEHGLSSNTPTPPMRRARGSIDHRQPQRQGGEMDISRRAVLKATAVGALTMAAGTRLAAAQTAQHGGGRAQRPRLHCQRGLQHHQRHRSAHQCRGYHDQPHQLRRGSRPPFRFATGGSCPPMRP